jgi:succinoglycan biosynthesis transport protein ExoP
MNIGQLLRILWARRQLVLAVMMTAVALTLLAKIVLPPTYVAATSLVIDTKAVDPVTGAALPAGTTTNQLSTQIDVITSRAVALKVVDDLKLVEGTGEAAERARIGKAYELLGALTVKPTSGSNIVRIRFEDSDPQFAAAAANAFADAYVRTSLELKLDPSRRQNVWFEEQLRNLRNVVEERRQALSQYQRDHGIIATDERLDVENARLNDLSRQLVEAQRVQQEAQARQRQAAQTGNLSELPEIMSNSLLQSLKAELVRAEARLAELSERFDRNHPQYQMASAEVRALRDKIAAETGSVTASINQAVQIANRQVANLQQAFDEQNPRILALKRQRDEVSVLSREVESAQGAYDAVLERASKVRLESQLEHTSVAVLDRATPPGRPAPPGVLLSTVLAAVFGAMLGAAIGLLLEMLDRRVRAGDEISRLTGLEVLAEVPRLRASFRPPRARLTYGNKPPPLEANPA